MGPMVLPGLSASMNSVKAPSGNRSTDLMAILHLFFSFDT
jgi:hypothetical protein